METGLQKATVVKNYVGVNERTGSLFVNLKLDVGGEAGWTKVYVTPKSYGMARAALKKVGFDVDGQELRDIEDNDELLAGKEVLVNVFDDEYNGKTSRKIEIALDRPKVDKSKLTEATEGLRKAKHANGDSEEDIPF